MTRLGFSITGVRAEPYAAVPTLVFRLRIGEAAGERVHAVALRCQIRIEAPRRAYSPEEQERLGDLFGEPARWGETLRAFPWTNAVVLAPEFEGAVEVDLPVACTYDLEVTAGKYFQALDGGEVPLLFLFSGTVFACGADRQVCAGSPDPAEPTGASAADQGVRPTTKGAGGLHVERVPWDREAQFRLPVAVWRELMDRYFPGSGWIRLRRESLDALQRYKSRRALLTWDDTIEALIDEVRTCA